ncbi:MAG TPA: hypothetical protein VGE72_21745 [Azospirillum sp.]
MRQPNDILITMDDRAIAERLGPDPTPRLARAVLWLSAIVFAGVVLLVLAGALRMALPVDLLVPVAAAGTGWAAWSVIDARATAVLSHRLAAEALRSGHLASAWLVGHGEGGELLVVDPANWRLFVVDSVIDLDDVGRLDLDGAVLHVVPRAPGARGWRIDLGDRVEAADLRHRLAELIGID